VPVGYRPAADGYLAIVEHRQPFNRRLGERQLLAPNRNSAMMRLNATQTGSAFSQGRHVKLTQ
jgi:hypothetical protein